MSCISTYNLEVFVLYSNGAITFDDAPGVYAARPIFFLNLSVTYKSGLGTKDSSIILEDWYSLRKRARNGKNS